MTRHEASLATSSSDGLMPPPRIALCLAGALREFHLTWPAVNHNLVIPTNASVFVVTSCEQDAFAGSRTHRIRAQRQALEELHNTIGRPFRGGAVWGDSELATRNEWAGVAALNASRVLYLWPYFLKRWA